MRSSMPTVLAASLAINILGLALPIIILQVYDRVIPNQSRDTFLILALILAGALVVESLLRAARSHVAGWAGAQFEHARGSSGVASLLNADLGTVESEPIGVHLDRLSAVDALRDFNANQGPLVLIDLPFALLFIGLIYVIAGPLIGVPVIVLALFVLVAGLTGGRLRRAIERRAVMDDRRYNFIIEVLTDIHTVKSQAMEAQMLRRYERLIESTGHTGYDVAFLSNLSQGLGGVFSQMTMVAVAAGGSLLALAGDLTIGGLAACTLLAGRAMQPLLRAMGIWTQFQAVRIARQRLAALSRMPRESGPTAGPVPPLAGAVELRGIRFRHGPDEPWLFDGLDLKIAAGETVAIHGENGAGKSTLMWLIDGALKPDAGTILIDGIDIAGLDRHGLRAQIGFLPQRGDLFQGTILENLTVFRGDAAIDDALEAARRVGLDEVVAGLPRGYETAVGDSAIDTLSGGVRQRVAIARALTSRPKLVLFDEANTSLDGQGDRQVGDVLARLKGGCTLLLVSYRPSILRLADRVLELKDGRLTPAVAAAAPAMAPEQAS